MSYRADCPACGQSVHGGATCDCGYLQLTTYGRAWTQVHGGIVRRIEPNVLVIEVADDPPERGPTPKRRGSGGETPLPDAVDDGEGQVDGDGGADRMD